MARRSGTTRWDRRTRRGSRQLSLGEVSRTCVAGSGDGLARARPAGRPCGCRPAAMSWCATCPGTRRGHVRAADPPIEKRHAPAPHAGLDSTTGHRPDQLLPGNLREPARASELLFGEHVTGRHQTPRLQARSHGDDHEPETRRAPTPTGGRWRWSCTGWTFYPHEAGVPMPPLQGEPGSGACGDWRYLVMNRSSRLSSAPVSRICLPQAEATTAAGSPGYGERVR